MTIEWSREKWPPRQTHVILSTKAPCWLSEAMNKPSQHYFQMRPSRKLQSLASKLLYKIKPLVNSTDCIFICSRKCSYYIIILQATLVSKKNDKFSSENFVLKLIKFNGIEPKNDQHLYNKHHASMYIKYWSITRVENYRIYVLKYMFNLFK